MFAVVGDYEDSADERNVIFDPHHEKTCLRDFRPGPTQMGLYTASA